MGKPHGEHPPGGAPKEISESVHFVVFFPRSPIDDPSVFFFTDPFPGPGLFLAFPPFVGPPLPGTLPRRDPLRFLFRFDPWRGSFGIFHVSPGSFGPSFGSGTPPTRISNPLHRLKKTKPPPPPLVPPVVGPSGRHLNRRLFFNCLILGSGVFFPLRQTSQSSYCCPRTNERTPIIFLEDLPTAFPTQDQWGPFFLFPGYPFSPDVTSEIGTDLFFEGTSNWLLFMREPEVGRLVDAFP